MKKSLPPLQYQELIEQRCKNPHSILGLHPYSKQKKVIRYYRPGAENLRIELLGKIIEAKPVDSNGLFEIFVPSYVTKEDYRIFFQSGLLIRDPFSFQSSCSDYDIYLFHKGNHYQVYRFMGAHRITYEGVEGVRFVVWAPNALGVSVVADFNHWNGLPMRKISEQGIWELFVPALQDYEKYKFAIKGRDGIVRQKADPYAFYSEIRPKTASVIYERSFVWDEGIWEEEQKKYLSQPINIYEVHLGSWKKKKKGFYHYRELAHDLAAYCLKMHFTHIELLPIMEHPLDESWGYQITGFYCPTSRFGTPDDFRYFINYMHQNKIGVIVDWVPAHFPNDDFSLKQFDGNFLYEYADGRKRCHPHWNTSIFDYGRNEVINFLIGSALFWLEEMHADGIRVDAVASMLYLDYGRQDGNWLPNQYGGNHNLEAIEFFKHLNSIIRKKHLNKFIIAEESTAFSGVTQNPENQGLGFTLKWNMGWMNDILRYFSKDPIYRKYHHKDLTFSFLYVFSEKFLLPLSHDEVVHNKRSLLNKMPGERGQQFAHLRLLYSYMMCHPGKKLLFMGTEFGEIQEWDCKREIGWELLQYPEHRQLHEFVQSMNRFYRENPALWEHDFGEEGFRWIDGSDSNQSVISFLRKGKSQTLLCIHHFTPIVRNDYWIPLRDVIEVQEIFNTCPSYEDGRILPISPSVDKNRGIQFSIPPLSTVIFEVKIEGH